MGVNALDTVTRPIIGLTSYLEEAITDGCGNVRAAFLPETYIAPILAAGGLPVLLPPQALEGAAVEHLLGRLDGLVVAGGWDIDPARYGQEPHAETDTPRRDRDAWEDALIREAVRQDIPLLCICRGEQMLNVALGGTLHQHLPDVVASGQYQLGDHKFNEIPVDLKPGSRLSALFNAETLGGVPVSHHQAVDRLGEGLVAAAWSEHQVVEAIEYPANHFCMGVQWHPEQAPEAQRVLFEGFVGAAREERVTRALHHGAEPVAMLAPELQSS
jgi:putative glutamine amidotransferase